MKKREDKIKETKKGLKFHNRNNKYLPKKIFIKYEIPVRDFIINLKTKEVKKK